MKLTEKEFKRFNTKYIILSYIIPMVLFITSLYYLFIFKGTNLFLLVLSGIIMVSWFVLNILMIINPKSVYTENGIQIDKYSYKEDNMYWFGMTSAITFFLFLFVLTICYIKEDKWQNIIDKHIINDTLTIKDTNEYTLTSEDSINIIELAKIAELECASNFSDSLLKLEKSKPNRFEMQDIIQVIFNRVDSHHPSFKNAIYEVLRQDKQFQPYTSGKFDDYHCSNESIRIAKENYILWKTTGHSNSLLPKTVIGFCSAEYAESANVVNVWNGWKRVEGKSLRVSANGMRLHYFYSIK